MQGITFFLIICILAFFEIDIESYLKDILTKFPIIKPEYVTKYIDVLKPILISAGVFLIQKTIYNLKFLKMGVFITINQKNKRNKINETVINQCEILEPIRTVVLDINLNTKKSLRNYLIKKFLYRKRVFLCVFLEEEDKNYISLTSDEGIEDNSEIKFEITSYLRQIINLELPGNEEYKYIIELELEPSQEKKKKIIINLKLLIDDKPYDDIKILGIFKLKNLLKLQYTEHIVDLNKEKE
ncbi:MAG: hypothetical protein ACRC8M_00230 [Cetobacterium sp.]|uniref:hypothetical protein n=1 Tax=Cetobacterium sp. TaxID=2071632 RepID=UPI003F409477